MAAIIHAMTGAAADEALQARLKSPEAMQLMSGVTATSRQIVYRRYLKRFWITYADIVWAYRQVAQSHATLGCCGGVLEEFRIVMRLQDGHDVSVSSDREQEAVQLLDLIRQNNPACAIGYTEENRQRFGVPSK